MAPCGAASLIGNGLIAAEPALLPSYMGADPRRAVLTEGAVDGLYGAGCTLCHIPGPHGTAGWCFPLAAQEMLQVIGQAVLWEAAAHP